MSHEVHAYTPTLSVVESRGLPVRLIACHRQVSADTPTLRATRHQYDAAGRLIASQDPRLPTPNQRTVYSLSGQALLTDSVDAGWRLGLPGEAGQALVGWDSRGTERQTEYDELLRPVAVIEQDQVVERFAYGGPETADDNQCNQLTRHDDTAGTLYRPDYGLLGSPLTEVRHFLHELEMPDWPQAVAERNALLEANGLESGWAFNALGEVIGQTDAMGNTRHFEQTVAGQLKSVALGEQVLVSEIRYNAFDQVEQETAGNGVISRSTYDPQDGRLNELSAGLTEASPLQNLKYNYDPVGNIVEIEDAAQPVRFFANQRIEPVNHYRYDTLYQLIEATGREVKTGSSHGPALPDLQNLPPAPNQVANYTQNYDYDAGGNLLEMRHVGAQGFTRAMRVAPDSNRSLPDDELDFEAGFDANGNLQQLVRGQDLTWDVRNQLRQISTVQRDDGPSDNETYIYDGGGQRCRKVSSAHTRNRTLISEVRYLPGLELRSEPKGGILHVISVQAGRSSVRVLHWVANKPTAIANDQLRYSLNDHLGSSTLELDDQGGLISQEGYYPFGGTAWWAARSAIEAKYKTVRYSGKERDASGLYYYGFRYYAPWLLRWVNPDPAGTADGLNQYAMVRNNPINLLDDSGMESRVAQRWKHALAAVSPVKVQTIAPGIIRVNIRGDNSLFQRIGIPLTRSVMGERNLTYLSIDASYKSKVSGGVTPLPLKTMSGTQINLTTKVEADYTAYINGSFYNDNQQLDSLSPTYASIGSNIIDGKARPYAPIPMVYKGEYVPLTLQDKSMIHSGPQLSRKGNPVFGEDMLQKGRFRYGPETNDVGSMGHADTPNPRSAISIPQNAKSAGRTRLAISLVDRRDPDSPGFTLPEWSNVMARLDRLDGEHAGNSMNLDGGGSSNLGVVARSGKILMRQASLTDPGRRIGNFISLSKRNPGFFSVLKNRFLR